MKKSLSKASEELIVGHTRGDSLFVSDLACETPLKVSVIPSPIACGRLKSLKFEKALKHPEVMAIYTAKDLKNNRWGPIVHDQPLIVDKEISFRGETLGLIVATSEKVIKEAIDTIEMDLEEMAPLIGINQAIKKEAYLDDPQVITRGDVDHTFSQASATLTGELSIGSQEQFYFETQCAVAKTVDGRFLEIDSSTQNPTEVQHVVAQALGLSYDQVTIRVRRIGGGFGGKETQSAPFAVYAALASYKLQRPCSLVLSHHQDMQITGKRHPFLAKYSVAFNRDGTIEGLKVSLTSDGGAFLDLSPAIMQRALLHLDNAYFIPAVNFRGRTARTNIPPNTAFRGFGAPQAIAVIEYIMDEIAQYTNQDPLHVRMVNLYQIERGLVTPYGQKIADSKLKEIADQFIEWSGYQRKKEEVTRFNQQSTSKRRGLGLSFLKFGISFTNRILNQGNALVNLHLDGSVQISTGAIEMGQGVNGRIARLVANCFGISEHLCRVMPTSTDKNHNTSPTAASTGTDINGMAALMAAEKIRYRLSILFSLWLKQQAKGVASNFVEFDLSQFTGSEQDLAKIEFRNALVIDNPSKRELPLADLLQMAHQHRISLGDYAFYKTPGISYQASEGKGTPFLYYTNGVALTEVEIDRLTGETAVLNADLLMDLGRPISKELDEGQIVGAYIQGMGWATSEILNYQQGDLLNTSATTYKIPSIQDYPQNLRIKLLDNSNEPTNVKGSKAVGEPPFVLGLSAWTAIRHALMDAGVCLNKLPLGHEEILESLYPKELVFFDDN